MSVFRYIPGNHYTEEQKQLDKRIFRHSLFFPTFLIVLLWLIRLFETEFHLDLVQGGIYPLHVKGLLGILTAPLVHGSFSHLMANTVPLFVLTLALLFFYRDLAYRIFFLIWIISGIFVWLGAREAWHIGASGVIYGLAAFLFMSGIVRNNVRLLTISIIVVFLYGGLFWGIFPMKPEISWEGHLWGGVSGIVLAVVYRKKGPPAEQHPWDEDDEEDEVSSTEEKAIETFPVSDSGKTKLSDSSQSFPDDEKPS